MEKEHNYSIKKLETEQNSMEKDFVRHYSKNLFKNICKYKFWIHDIFKKKAEYAMFRLKTQFYESGEKTGRLLLKEQSLAHIIPAIRAEGSLITGINYVFKELNENLYKSSGAINESIVRDFLKIFW